MTVAGANPRAVSSGHPGLYLGLRDRGQRGCAEARQHEGVEVGTIPRHWSRVAGRRRSPTTSSSHSARVTLPWAGSVQVPRSLAASISARYFSASTLRRKVLIALPASSGRGSARGS